MSRQHTWLFKKNCSWPPRKLGSFYLSLGFLVAVLCSIFFHLGMWMVVPFGLIEIFALATAFFVYARGATDFERITVNGRTLVVEQRHADHVMRHVFNLEWCRIEWAGANGSLLYICQGQSRLPVGKYLSSTQRKALATDLKKWMGNRTVRTIFA